MKGDSNQPNDTSQLSKKQNPSDYCRSQVAKLIQELGIPKVKIGEILGSKDPSEKTQQKFNRADRFLKGKSKIEIDTVYRLAEFFRVPLFYFLPNLNFSHILRSDEPDIPPPRPLDEVEKNLKAAGFDETFVKQEIEKLRSKL